MKKGSIGEETIHLILIIILIIIVGVTINTLVQAALNQRVESFPVESAIFIERVLQSKDGISVLDPATGQIIQGIIDYDRVRLAGYEDVLDASMQSEHPLSARMTITGETMPELIIHYHKDEFDQAQVYHQAGVSGEGSVHWEEKTLPAIIRSGDSEERGVVMFEIALPKSLKVIQ